jgi:hypothetical protein
VAHNPSEQHTTYWWLIALQQEATQRHDKQREAKQEKKEAAPLQRNFGILWKSLSVLRTKDAQKLLGACKILRREGAGESVQREASHLACSWLERIEPAQIADVGHSEGLRAALPPPSKFLQEPNFCACEESRIVLRATFQKM